MVGLMGALLRTRSHRIIDNLHSNLSTPSNINIGIPKVGLDWIYKSKWLPVCEVTRYHWYTHWHVEEDRLGVTE